MTKKLAIALFIAFGFSANAQVTIRPGIRAGANFSKFTNSDTDTKTDFFIGGTLAIKFKRFYTLQPEISYSRQGARFTQNTVVAFENLYDPAFSSRRIDYKYQLDYLTVAIINKFTFGKAFQVMVGPSLDFKVDDNFASFSSERPQDFDLALVLGVGYVFPNGLGIDLRIKQGMIDIFGNNVSYNSNYNNNNDYYYDDSYNNNVNDIVLNQVIQLGVSYSFGMK